MRRLLLVPVSVVVLAIAGCGSSADSASAPPSSSAAAPAKAPATGDVAQVGMEGLQFGPKDITVKVGEKITWTNNEDISHNVTAQEGADFASDTFAKGGTFSFTPTKAGTIKYVCTIHPGMDGTITVEG